MSNVTGIGPGSIPPDKGPLGQANQAKPAESKPSQPEKISSKFSELFREALGE